MSWHYSHIEITIYRLKSIFYPFSIRMRNPIIQYDKQIRNTKGISKYKHSHLRLIEYYAFEIGTHSDFSSVSMSLSMGALAWLHNDSMAFAHAVRFVKPIPLGKVHSMHVQTSFEAGRYNSLEHSNDRSLSEIVLWSFVIKINFNHRFSMNPLSDGKWYLRLTLLPSVLKPYCVCTKETGQSTGYEQMICLERWNVHW